LSLVAVEATTPKFLEKSVRTTRKLPMKADIHPKYETVVFRDLASGVAFLTRSTVSSSKTIEWEDGNSYPVFDVEISSASHPFYTGKQRIMDTAGRVERFNARYKGFGA
jgi:large subunit ribosomal protein L31